MSDQPITPASLRGAIDLSGLAKKPARPAAGSRASGAAGGAPAGPGEDSLVREVDDVTFGHAVQQSMDVPVIFALYSGARPASREHIDTLVGVVREYAGRLVLASADIDVAMQIRQALQVQQVPMVLALVKGQPLPLYAGDQPVDAVRGVFDKVLEAAAANGVTGRVPVGDAPAADGERPAEPEISPLHEQAYAAIESGDYAAAVRAYEQAIAADPQDEEAVLGLGQVRLLQRTDGVDLQEARAAAAAAPTDVEKQTVVADLDVLGGHVEDAFVRLVDLVRVTSGDERNAARQHLIGLFDVVGPSDPRVKKARTALMSALY
ncbi:tetratricopeptide repeat protein [Allobranchiibius sp. GilTou73]|uniref:tetratricopeptide repeat protein n=1 Tax=Allobranchiibius sp. GilTou73 TaxID=2904523 RepID=UPI001F2BC32C|nr:tetratricopeptide repeat protein [Allobranchiibius sp. GilTou73]UIJ36436.1 tetratricopeptide repeat protein [Allobranchiibius sp. GilTou73]